MLPQPVKAKSTDTASDAAITFLNLFFMILNLLFHLIFLIDRQPVFSLKIRNDSILHPPDRLSYILRSGYTPDGLVFLLL